MTHYIQAFCEVSGRKQKAACGTWVTAREHSVEPTCDDCRLYLTAEADTYDEMAGELGVEFLPPVKETR